MDRKKRPRSSIALVRKNTIKPITLDGYLCDSLVIHEFSHSNKFLAELLSELVKPKITERSLNRKFSIRNVEILVDTFIKTGISKRVHSFDDLNNDPLIFWELIDYATKHCVKTNIIPNARIYSVWYFYKRLSHAEIFDEYFKNHPKSIYYCIDSRQFLEALYEGNMNPENYFQIRFNSKGHPRFVSYKTKSLFLLKRMAISAENHDINYFTPSHAYDVFMEFENLVYKPSNIKGYKDFTVELFEKTLNNILIECADDEYFKKMNLRLWFFIWQDIMTEYNNYDFFKDSPMWSSETIFQKKTISDICNGYKPVLCQLLNDIPDYDKILFISHDTDKRSSRGVGYQQHTADMSEIEDPLYRRLGMAYTNYNLYRGTFLHSSYKGIYRTLIEPIKRNSTNKYYFTHSEIKRMYGLIINSDRNDVSKSSHFGYVKALFKFAEQNGFLTIEKGAFRSFREFPTYRERKPSSLSTDELNKLDKALLELGNKSIRHALARNAMHIQLNSSTRIGEILSLRLDEIFFDENGTSIVKTVTKNNYNLQNQQIFSKVATDYIKNSIDLTRDIRRTMPESELKKCIFIRKDKHCATGSIYQNISNQKYNDSLRQACEIAGIRRITSGNIRDTALTAFKKFSRKEHLPTNDVQSLIGHMKADSANNYDDLDFRDILEAVDGISIGKILKNN